MDNRLYDLYFIPDSQRQLLEGYIDMRNELEFQSVKLALRFGKKHG